MADTIRVTRVTAFRANDWAASIGVSRCRYGMDSNPGITRAARARRLFQSLLHGTATQGLLLQQLLRQRSMGRAMAPQQHLSTLVLFCHETLDLRVDDLTRLRTDLNIALDRARQVLELLTG